MLKRQKVFKEKSWTVLKTNWGRVDVGHIGCPQSNGRIPGPTELTNTTTYTWARDDQCWFCDKKFPEFISNMLTFMKWCGER